LLSAWPTSNSKKATAEMQSNEKAVERKLERSATPEEMFQQKLKKAFSDLTIAKMDSLNSVCFSSPRLRSLSLYLYVASFISPSSLTSASHFSAAFTRCG
jgi:hypothetical protein